MLGEAYLVSGSSERVEEYIKGKKCINIDSMAGFKAATIIGKINDENKMQITDLQLETSKVELQKLFIHLTGEEEVK